MVDVKEVRLVAPIALAVGFQSCLSSWHVYCVVSSSHASPSHASCARVMISRAYRRRLKAGLISFNVLSTCVQCAYL